MFWIPKYNKNPVLIVYSSTVNDVVKLESESIFTFSSSAKMFFLEHVLQGTGSSELFGTKNVSPTLQYIFLTFRIISASNSQPQPISSTTWVGKTELSTHCLGMVLGTFVCHDCNKISVCKSLLLLESEIIFRLYPVKGSESVGFKLESRPLLVPLWPNPPI